jgi:hypothetical protein
VKGLVTSDPVVRGKDADDGLGIRPDRSQDSQQGRREGAFRLGFRENILDGNGGDGSHMTYDVRRLFPAGDHPHTLRRKERDEAKDRLLQEGPVAEKPLEMLRLAWGGQGPET